MTAGGYTHTLSGERLTMSLPGGGSWSCAYLAQILPKDDPNSVSRMLQRITDDQGGRVDYVQDDMGFIREAITNQSFDMSGSLVSYQKARYEVDSDGGVPPRSRGW